MDCNGVCFYPRIANKQYDIRAQLHTLQNGEWKGW